MKNDKQRNNTPNDPPKQANDPWNKPIGRIIIGAIGSVIAGTIVIFIGIGINRSCTQAKPPNQVATDKKAPEKNTEKREDATHQTPPIKKQQKVALHKEVAPVKEKPIEKSETYNVKSENQSGGITAGKIENVNIITDKESLGIREPDGLYLNGKKLGTVINFKANESLNTFTISEIQFDKPLYDTNIIWQPLTYRKYALHIRQIDDLAALMPPIAKGVTGNILSSKP